MTTDEVEAYGRAALTKRAESQEASAQKWHAKATKASQAGKPFGGLRQQAGLFEELARETRESLGDVERYLWRITVGGGYGTFHYVGTPCHAEGRRALKAQWEGAPARVEKVRPALPTEPTGEWEAPEATRNQSDEA